MKLTCFWIFQKHLRRLPIFLFLIVHKTIFIMIEVLGVYFVMAKRRKYTNIDHA